MVQTCKRLFARRDVPAVWWDQRTLPSASQIATTFLP
jgi:hypothetical protein